MPRARTVCKHVWANGTRIQTRYYKAPPKHADQSDRIWLEIAPGKGRGKPAAFFLNVEDAMAIIHALSVAANFALNDRTSAWPVEG